MIEVSKNPVLLARMPYGKHKGMRFEDIPVDYLQWLSETDLDEDLADTVRRYLEDFPQKLGDLNLANVIQDKEATAIINKMHGKILGDCKNYIAYYGSNDSQNILYLSEVV